MKPEFQHAPDYLCLMRGGAYHRLFVLKQMAHQNGKTWRECRSYGFHNWASAFAHFSQGANDGTPVWVTHTGEYFRDERFAHEVADIRHNGWYTRHDSETFKDGSGLARGIVARLTHGRFIAGYWWGDNGERVWFDAIYTDERDAARAADSHAEEWAEICRDDSERFDAMQMAEFDVEEKTTELQESIALRHISKFGGRNRVRRQIDDLRQARQELKEKTQDYENGGK